MIDEEALKSIENLHRLKDAGIITAEEFEQSKRRLLFGAKPAGSKSSTPLAALNSYAGVLPGKDEHVGWITLPLRRYADFQGRSTRKEFWMFQLLPLGLFLGCAILSAALGAAAAVLLLLGLLGLFIPQLAVQIRRFHDQDRSGWLAALNLIPYIGPFVVFAFMLIDGTRGDNRFGADPKAP